ncbi:MAG: hypothetical protein ACC662_05525, partial [Planctomycetota bacterium]
MPRACWTARTRDQARRPIDLGHVVDFDEVITCPPVIREVLQGVREDRAHAALRRAMLALPRIDAPIPLERHQAAADLYRRARKRGLTVRSGV